jgi:diguanylate cyclase (GGDEF)-like protein
MDTGARSQYEWRDRNGGAKFGLTKRLISAAAILLAGLLPGGVVAQTPLTALTAIRQLNSVEANKGLPVALEAPATHFHSDQRNIRVIDSASPFANDVRFHILPCSPEDIAVLAATDWLNVRLVTTLAGLLFFLMLALGIREWYLERRNRRQIATLAYVEQRRSQILEDINHSKPLAGILERITELVSVRLNGAPCWCRIEDGATLGNRPAQFTSESLRTVEYPIAARSGPPLGTIFAAFHTLAKSNPAEKEALAMAAGLATLAIETSRLYSDLVHRSEFDLLTDVPNRFAMKKALDALIQAARQSAGIFGVIYVDLNKFKQVNDEYGHQLGDMYLQEIARRMKRQLRPCDTLARLGGDEFAVLVAEVRNRAEVQVIAMRLECCFDEPFLGEGYAVHGSASVGIALYPEDADSADGMLRTADAAMYLAKYTRIGKNGAPEAHPEDEFAPKEQS